MSDRVDRAFNRVPPRRNRTLRGCRERIACAFCLFVPQVPRKSRKESHQVKDQVWYQLANGEPGDFPEGKARTSSVSSSSSGGSDHRPSGGRALVKYEGLVGELNERCRGCASFAKKPFIICACSRSPLVNGYSVPLPPVRLFSFFLLSLLLPAFSCHAPT